MGQFKVTEQRMADQVNYEFYGHIDEDTDFGKLPLNGIKKVTIDLAGVNAINSCGIREWIKWIRTAETGSSFTFKKAQKAIIDQINMIDGFIPKGSNIESFYVPYFCEECDTASAILFTRGKEFNAGRPQVKESIPCSNCGKNAEIDVIEAQYFRFLD